MRLWRREGARPGCISRRPGAGSGAAELLVARGTDLDATDDDYKATPAGWANHFGHKDIAAFLLCAAKTMVA